ncbi:unnamed protein product, partial [Candidula unifasciata]
PASDPHPDADAECLPLRGTAGHQPGPTLCLCDCWSRGRVGNHLHPVRPLPM